jgi:hypothetical protein
LPITVAPRLYQCSPDRTRDPIPNARGKSSEKSLGRKVAEPAHFSLQRSYAAQ